MRIGLITIYNVPNYGSILQAYATQELIRKLGHECTILRYKYPNEWHYLHGFYKPNKYRELARRIYFKLKRNKDVKNDFRNSFFNYSQEFESLEELDKGNWEEYDAFVVGSDQVWNPRFTYGDSAYMLSFAPDDKPRFSFASSFATDKIPVELISKYKKHLSKFAALSVRENNGVDIIHEQLKIDKDVFVCLDPTLLLSKEDWLALIPRSKFQKKRPYILYYMWDYAFDPKPYIYEVVDHYRKLIGDCDVIALEGYSRTDPDIRKNWINASNSTIPEFIDLFNNADLVVTSSFHGTAFALNFGIPLISITPNGKADDRQSSLAKALMSDSCLLQIYAELTDNFPKYNVCEEQAKLQEERNYCIYRIKMILKT